MANTLSSQPNAQTFVLADIVEEVRAGKVRIPRFQRGLRWQWEDVRRLFDSILKGYPIGSFLFWQRQGPKAQIRIGSLTVDAPKGDALWIVDGQQRITSLVNALSALDGLDPRFSLGFDLKAKALRKPSERDPSHVIPLPVFFDLQKLILWFSEHKDLDPSLLNGASTSTVPHACSNSQELRPRRGLHVLRAVVPTPGLLVAIQRPVEPLC